MKRAIFVHRWSGGPLDDWRLWLKSELEQRGFTVLAPAMPDTEEPDIEKWTQHLHEVVGQPDTETYFVGHSVGCQAILRYLQTIHTSVGGAVFVAGWFNLENLEDDEVKAVARPWIETQLDFSKIKQVLSKSTLLISQDDPYGAYAENIQKFTELGSHCITLQQAGHITDLKVPAILNQCLETFGS